MNNSEQNWFLNWKDFAIIPLEARLGYNGKKKPSLKNRKIRPESLIFPMTCTRKAVECFKWVFMSCSSKNMKDCTTEIELHCADLAQEDSVEKNLWVCGLDTVYVLSRWRTWLFSTLVWRFYIMLSKSLTHVILLIITKSPAETLFSH